MTKHLAMLLPRLSWLAMCGWPGLGYVLVDPSEYDPSYTSQTSFDSDRSVKECFCGTLVGLRFHFGEPFLLMFRSKLIIQCTYHHRFQTPPPQTPPPLGNNPEIRFRNNPEIRIAISYFRVIFSWVFKAIQSHITRILNLISDLFIKTS